MDNEYNLSNYFNYFTEIEEHFVRRRGRNLLVTPLDWCLIEFWKNQGIPLLVVLRGIDRSFEAAAKRSKKPPTSLFYCHPAVIEAFEEYQEARVGAHESPDAPDWKDRSFRDRVLDYLRRLAESLRKRDEGPFHRCAEHLASLAN